MDQVSTSAGFLDVKMRTLVVSHPVGAVLALAGPGSLACTVSTCSPAVLQTTRDTQHCLQVRIDPTLLQEAELYWTRDGQGTARDRTDTASVGESLYRLQHNLSEVTRQDAGRYSCHVITSYDSVRSRPAQLKVRSASRILGQPQTQTVMEGDTAQFR